MAAIRRRRNSADQSHFARSSCQAEETRESSRLLSGTSQGQAPKARRCVSRAPRASRLCLSQSSSPANPHRPAERRSIAVAVPAWALYGRRPRWHHGQPFQGPSWRSITRDTRYVRSTHWQQTFDIRSLGDCAWPLGECIGLISGARPLVQRMSHEAEL